MLGRNQSDDSYTQKALRSGGEVKKCTPILGLQVEALDAKVQGLSLDVQGSQRCGNSNLGVWGEDAS